MWGFQRVRYYSCHTSRFSFLMHQAVLYAELDITGRHFYCAGMMSFSRRSRRATSTLMPPIFQEEVRAGFIDDIFHARITAISAPDGTKAYTSRHRHRFHDGTHLRESAGCRATTFIGFLFQQSVAVVADKSISPR